MSAWWSSLGVTEISEISQGLGLDLALVEKRLNRALVARFGIDVGLEVTAETMTWAWEHRSRLERMDNPAGFLFRVGQSRSRRLLRWRRRRAQFPAVVVSGSMPWTEPQLPAALAELDEDQRTAVVLVHCFEWTYAEVAELVDVPIHTVRNRVHRGLTRLRRSLGVEC